MVQAFEVICEIEPATRPERHVRHQIGVLSRVASGFLIPDNHFGRGNRVSIAVVHEVGLMGGRAIAFLNARDRNLLGFRRDLLTAAAYGVEKFLLVFGDDRAPEKAPGTSPSERSSRNCGHKLIRRPSGRWWAASGQG